MDIRTKEVCPAGSHVFPEYGGQVHRALLASVCCEAEAWAHRWGPEFGKTPLFCSAHVLCYLMLLGFPMR